MGRAAAAGAEHFAKLAIIAERYGRSLDDAFGKGKLWGNKEAGNKSLENWRQLEKVKKNFLKSDIIAIRDAYRGVEEDSEGRNPSAKPRADLMDYYLRNW